MQEAKIEPGNEEIDRGAKDFAIISFRIFIQMTSIVNDGCSREFYVSLLDMLQTYLEIKRATIPLPFTTDSSHLRNHVQHLLQTHESYLIQWEFAWIKLWLYVEKKFELRLFLWVLRSWRQWSHTAQPRKTFDEHPFKLSNFEQWLLHWNTWKYHQGGFFHRRRYLGARARGCLQFTKFRYFHGSGDS